MGKTDLSWHSGSGKWMGRYKRKGEKKYQCHYFPRNSKPTGKSDRQAYRTAMEEWKQKQAELDAQETHPHQPALDRISKAIEWATTNETDLVTHLQELKAQITEITDQTAREDVNLLTYPLNGSLWEDRIKHLPTAPKAATVNSVEQLVKQYLHRRQSEVATKGLSISRWETIRIHLNKFSAFTGEALDINAINGAILDGFVSHLQEQIAVYSPADGSKKRIGYSVGFCRECLTSTKQFLKWCYKIEAIDRLPRMFDDTKLNVVNGAKKIEVFTVDEVKKLLRNTTDRTKLYLMLMLNCGFYQSDLSNLMKSEIDWVEGKITRKRSKTAKGTNAAEVTHKLWAETFRLLKQEVAATGDRALLTRDGGPLVAERIENGKRVKSDNIKSAYSRLCKQLKTRIKPLKCLRKTSSSMLANNPQYVHLQELFLGHVGGTLAAKHYTEYRQADFDNAVMWVGQQFGIK